METNKNSFPFFSIYPQSANQENRNTKILLSSQDWEEEISIQERDLSLLKNGNFDIRQISQISQRAMKRLQLINDGSRYPYEQTMLVYFDT